MATLAIPNSNFVAGTPAVADEVDANFEAVRSFVQTEVAHKDGTNAFTAFPTLPSVNPSSSTHPAPKGYVDTADASRLLTVNSGQQRCLFGSSTVTTDGSGNASVTFSSSFPSSCVAVVASPTTAVAAGAASWTTSGFVVKGPASTTLTVAWIALGT